MHHDLVYCIIRRFHTIPYLSFGHLEYLAELCLNLPLNIVVTIIPLKCVCGKVDRAVAFGHVCIG